MGSTFSCTLAFSSHKTEEEIVSVFEAEGFSSKTSEIFSCKKTSDTFVIVTFVRDVSYSSAYNWPDILKSILDEVGFQYEGDGNKVFYIVDLFGNVPNHFIWSAMDQLF